ncbi:MAG: hypothetical protein JKX69_12190 [Rhodobacteraceae bacterium]|nr:hypothetical protein [Paracoccaceae bacterium]
MAKLRKAHRLMARLLAVFLLLHLAHHLTLLGGTGAHLALGAWLAPLYRFVPLTVLLTIGFAAQAALGLVIAWRRGWPRTRWPRAQLVSGPYLAFFMAQHIGEVLLARAEGVVETNTHFAAAGLHIWPLSLYFIPYYALAIFALFVHLAAVLRRRAGPRPAAALALFGLGFGIAVSAGLAGLFGGPNPPQVYLDALRQTLGL